MEGLLEQIVGYPNMDTEARVQLAVSVRRFALAAMESGNPSPLRTVLREYAEYDAQASYSIRAELVKVYGQDI